MPTDKELWIDMDNRHIEAMDDEGNPVRIETMTGLTLYQEQDPDQVWENFCENMQFTITVDLDSAWYMRMLYLFGERKQRKTALEKRKRRARHDDKIRNRWCGRVLRHRKRESGIRGSAIQAPEGKRGL